MMFSELYLGGDDNESKTYHIWSWNQDGDCIMKEIGAIIKSVQKFMPERAQNELIEQLGNAEMLEAAPAGAILMGMNILEYVGFPRYIDQLQGEEHTTIEQLKEQYQRRSILVNPMIPSTGIILSLLVGIW